MERNAAATISLVGLGDLGEEIAGVVDSAALPGRALEAFADRGFQPLVRVGDDQAHPAETAAS